MPQHQEPSGDAEAVLGVPNDIAEVLERRQHPKQRRRREGEAGQVRHRASAGTLRQKFEELYDGTHPLRIALQKLSTLDTVRIIEGKA